MCSSWLSTGRWRKSRSGAFARPLPPPFAADFFFGAAALLAVAARDFVAAARERLVVVRVPSSVAAALAGDPAGGFPVAAAAGFAGAAAGFTGAAAGGFAGAVAPAFAADGAAGFAAGFLARSRVLAFPPVRGSLGIGSSLERTPAASAVRPLPRRGGRGRRP